MSAERGMSLTRLRDDVAAAVGVDPEILSADQSLLEQGLDSVRLMSLVAMWRAQGLALTFAGLAEHPTLREWIEMLDAGGGDEAR